MLSLGQLQRGVSINQLKSNSLYCIPTRCLGETNRRTFYFRKVMGKITEDRGKNKHVMLGENENSLTGRSKQLRTEIVKGGEKPLKNLKRCF